MLNVSKKALLSLLWLFGAGLASLNFYNEYHEFNEIQAQTSVEIKKKLDSLSVVTQKKSSAILDRIELNNRLLIEQESLIELIAHGEVISEDKLEKYQQLLALTKSKIAMITTETGHIIYNTPRHFTLIQNQSISHRPLYGRTQERGYAWDIYFDVSDSPSLMSSALAHDKSGRVIGQVVIEHQVNWIPFLKLVDTKLVLVNEFYQVGFHFDHNKQVKVRFEPEDSLLFDKKKSRPLPNIDSFSEDQIIHMTREKEFNIEYYHLKGAINQKVQISRAELSERWSLFFSVPIQNEIEHLFDEVFEIIQNTLAILLLCIILHRFIAYHYKIRLLTFTDELTRLHNRQHYTEFIPPMLSLHDRGKIEHLGLIVIDIDKFKSVNDTYGHAIGDIVLKSLAAHLKENSRDSDRIYRFGGEEFLIFTEGDSLDQLITFANRLRESVADIKSIKQHIPDGIRISAGVATRVRNEPLEALFQRTDHLLYKAKENGRNRVESE